MIDLGPRSKLLGAEGLLPLALYSRPTRMPDVPAGHQILCAFDRGIEVRMFVCETLQDMQDLDDRYAQGYALRIDWFHAEDAGFLLAWLPQPKKRDA